MRDVIPEIDRWLAAGKAVALATVTHTWGSAPRRPGAHMAISADGDIAGSVSGGCVEGAVVEEALAVLESGQARALHYGVTDEQSWEVGLACGGEIEIFVQLLDSGWYRAITARIAAEQPAIFATTLQGEQAGTVQLVDNWAGERQPYLDGENFVNVVLPRPQLVIVGGAHIAQALSQLAHIAGFHTTLVDPRRTFSAEARFPHIDNLLHAWPQQAFAEFALNASSAVATLTHDPKIDDPALIAALESPAFYIGALGSTRTHAKRVARLQEAGLSAAVIARIHGPIGLAINAVTPEEIALAIMAQIIERYRA